ncbi:MAG: hypothetical protein QM484_00635 [Woeseiaceae bacterium]
METGKIAIIVAIITMLGGLGTALIANLDKFKIDDTLPTKTPPSSKNIKIESELKYKIVELTALNKQLLEGIDTHKNEIEQKNNEIENLKKSFHQISNSKLKQLLAFHNDTVCYGRSLNFTHPAANDYAHCVKKELLAKQFLTFFEELEIIDSDGFYTAQKAKDELIALQDKYGFRDTGWYTELVLGILIIEYAKKS